MVPIDPDTCDIGSKNKLTSNDITLIKVRYNLRYNENNSIKEYDTVNTGLSTIPGFL